VASSSAFFDQRTRQRHPCRVRLKKGKGDWHLCLIKGGFFFPHVDFDAEAVSKIVLILPRYPIT
jgi:hypothetical protein